MQLFGKEGFPIRNKTQSSQPVWLKKNNLELSSIPTTVEDKDLESTVSPILSDINVTASSYDGKTCRRIGLSDKKSPNSY